MWNANLVIALLLAANLYSFLLMGVDKRRAQRDQWRISERRLLLSAACFGALGAWLGMQCFRHKTRHNRFRFGIPILLIIQLCILGWLVFKHIISL